MEFVIRGTLDAKIDCSLSLSLLDSSNLLSDVFDSERSYYCALDFYTLSIEPWFSYAFVPSVAAAPEPSSPELTFRRLADSWNDFSPLVGLPSNG